MTTSHHKLRWLTERSSTTGCSPCQLPTRSVSNQENMLVIMMHDMTRDVMWRWTVCFLSQISFICFRSSSSFLYQTHNQSGEKVQFSFCSPNFLVYVAKPQMFAVTVQKCFKSATSDSFRVWSLNSEWSVLFDFRSTLYSFILGASTCWCLVEYWPAAWLQCAWSSPETGLFLLFIQAWLCLTALPLATVFHRSLSHCWIMNAPWGKLGLQMLFPFLFWVDDVLFPLLGRSSTLPSFPHVWMQALTVEPQKWLCATI